MSVGDWKTNLSTSETRLKFVYTVETSKVPFIPPGTKEVFAENGLVHNGFNEAVASVW